MGPLELMGLLCLRWDLNLNLIFFFIEVTKSTSFGFFGDMLINNVSRKLWGKSKVKEVF